jgi:hypothetical protein
LIGLLVFVGWLLLNAIKQHQKHEAHLILNELSIPQPDTPVLIEDETSNHGKDVADSRTLHDLH